MEACDTCRAAGKLSSIFSIHKTLILQICPILWIANRLKPRIHFFLLKHRMVKELHVLGRGQTSIRNLFTSTHRNQINEINSPYVQFIGKFYDFWYFAVIIPCHRGEELYRKICRFTCFHPTERVFKRAIHATKRIMCTTNRINAHCRTFKACFFQTLRNFIRYQRAIRCHHNLHIKRRSIFY